MATFAKDNTDGRIPLLGWAITPETYQSINPATIVILAPFIGWLFTRRAGRFPSTIMKFAISVLIIGVSAFILGYGFQTWPGGQDLSPWWFLAVVFIIQTVAELFLSPGGPVHDVSTSAQELRLPDDEVEPARRPRGIAECRHEQDALMGATGVFGGPHEIRECSRHLAVIASASSSKQLT